LENGAQQDVLLTFQSVSNNYPFGVLPRFTVVLVNNASVPIDFSQRRSTNAICQPKLGFGIVGDGKRYNVSFGSDLSSVKTGMLDVGQGTTFDYPYPFAHDVLLPGVYTCRMWLTFQRDNRRGRVDSTPFEITVADTGSPEISKLRARRYGVGVAENLRLQLRGNLGGQFEVYAKDTGNTPLYLGGYWSVAWRKLFTQESEWYTGLDVASVDLQPHERRRVCRDTMEYMRMESGVYVLQVRYDNPYPLVKRSNRLFVVVFHPHPVYLTWPPSPLPAALIGCVLLLIALRIRSMRRRRRVASAVGQ
jgi:hypothetical protein